MPVNFIETFEEIPRGLQAVRLFPNHLHNNCCSISFPFGIYAIWMDGAPSSLSFRFIQIFCILAAAQIRVNYVRTPRIPLVKNPRNPLFSLRSPNTGSTICCRSL